MIPTLFARPITIWVTIIVLILHGLALSAMMSVETVVLPTTEPDEATPIQFELITLGAQEVSAVSSPLADQLANKKEPPIEEPPIEEPPIEEPPIEEPPIEEPPIEEPPVEEPPIEEPPVEEPPIEEPSVEEPSVEEPSVEEPPTEEPSVEEPSVEEPSVEEPPTEEPPTEEPPIEEPPIEEPPIEEPPIEEPPIEEPPIEEPPIEEPPIEEPPIEEPPIEEPPIEEPPIEEPPIEKSSVTDPPDQTGMSNEEIARRIHEKYRYDQWVQAYDAAQRAENAAALLAASTPDIPEADTQTESPVHVFSVREVSWRSLPEAGCPSLALPVGMQRSIDMVLALSVDTTGTITKVQLAPLTMSSNDKQLDTGASIAETEQGSIFAAQLAHCQFNPLQKGGNIVAGVVILPISLSPIP